MVIHVHTVCPSKRLPVLDVEEHPLRQCPWPSASLCLRANVTLYGSGLRQNRT